MSRTFFVRVNMDDMCAELDTLRPDQHAEWLAGFRAGCRGRIPDGWDGPRLMGAEFGMSCWEEAEGYRAKQSECGKRSAAARKQKFGTAIPEGGSNHPPKVVRRSSEPEPNPSNIQHLTSNSEQPASSAPASEDPFSNDPSPVKELPPATHMAACDAKFTSGDLLSQVRRIGGRMTRANGNLEEWQSLIDEHGFQKVSDAAKKVGPADRWPSKVGQVIWDTANTCPHPPGSDAAMNWWVLHAAIGDIK